MKEIKKGGWQEERMNGIDEGGRKEKRKEARKEERI